MTRGLTLASYVVIAAALCAYELVARRRRRATLGAFVAWVTRRRPSRWALLGAWLWLGWHIFVRVESPG